MGLHLPGQIPISYNSDPPVIGGNAFSLQTNKGPQLIITGGIPVDLFIAAILRAGAAAMSRQDAIHEAREMVREYNQSMRDQHVDP